MRVKAALTVIVAQGCDSFRVHSHSGADATLGAVIGSDGNTRHPAQRRPAELAAQATTNGGSPTSQRSADPVIAWLPQTRLIAATPARPVRVANPASNGLPGPGQGRRAGYGPARRAGEDEALSTSGHHLEALPAP